MVTTICLFRRTLFAVGCFGLTALADSQDDNSHFTYPAEEGLKFYAKDSVNVTWDSQYESCDLWLFCEERGEAIVKDKIDNVQSGKGSEIVVISQDVSNNACWFNLRRNDGDGTELGINTPHFALRRNERDSGGKTTLGPGSGAESTTSVAQSSTASTAADETTTTEKPEATDKASTKEDQQNADKDDGLSTGAKAGIGIGVALGVIALAGVIVVVIMRKRRRDRGSPDLVSDKHHEHSELHGAAAPSKHQYYDPPKPLHHGGPQEMSAAPAMEQRAGAHEMPG